MHLIEQQPHFWELYQNQDQYYLSIAVDMSSVVSCWDLQLTNDEIDSFKNQGREVIENLTNLIIAEVYRGDFSSLEGRVVAEPIKQQMQAAFQMWRINTR